MRRRSGRRRRRRLPRWQLGQPEGGQLWRDRVGFGLAFRAGNKEQHGVFLQYFSLIVSRLGTDARPCYQGALTR